MKINLLVVIIVLCTLNLSCSSDSSEESTTDTTVDTDTNQDVIKFIKKIQAENPESYENGTQFFYDNDRLTYVYLDDCSGELNYYEYNSDGKISARYNGQVSIEGDNFNPNTFDINEFKQRGNVLNYVYEGGKLIKMQKNEDYIDYHIIYNSNGKVEVVEWSIPGVGLWEKVEITYSNGKISNFNKKEYDTDGSLNDNYNYTFEYDDNPNPFYIISQNYSLLNLYSCTSFDFVSTDDIGLKLFANNVKTVKRDGELIYSASYQYDSDNYPIRVSSTNLNGNYSRIELITYIP